MSLLITARRERPEPDTPAAGDTGGALDTDNEGSADSGRERNSLLESVLSAIADEVSKFSSGLRRGITAIYGARAAAARMNLKGPALVAALRAIQEEKRAALAVIKLQAAMELTARRRAAIEKYSTITLMSQRKKARLLKPGRG